MTKNTNNLFKESYNLNSSTRNKNTLIMFKKITNYDYCLHSFTKRIINTWNDLPDKVICVESTETLKVNLDRHFSTLMYNTKIDLSLNYEMRY